MGKLSFYLEEEEGYCYIGLYDPSSSKVLNRFCFERGRED